MYDVAFCIPTTSHNREWISSDDSYLHRILLDSCHNYSNDVHLTFYIGFDQDDEIFSSASQRNKLNEEYPQFHIEWIPFSPEKGNVVRIWNKLAEIAVENGHTYLMILGDDIKLPKDSGWLNLFIKNLKKQNNIGWAAGWSNNDNIATQFLIHKTHLDIFGFVFPPQIKNWFCDNWMNDIYPAKYKSWRKDYHLLNVGGAPRYQPINDQNLCQMLVKRHRSKLTRHLNLIIS